jgi:hypothetical protein
MRMQALVGKGLPTAFKTILSGVQVQVRLYMAAHTSYERHPCTTPSVGSYHRRTNIHHTAIKLPHAQKRGLGPQA